MDRWKFAYAGKLRHNCVTTVASAKAICKFKAIYVTIVCSSFDKLAHLHAKSSPETCTQWLFSDNNKKSTATRTMLTSTIEVNGQHYAACSQSSINLDFALSVENCVNRILASPTD